MRIRILGSGTSAGVPVIGCHCEVCSSSDPKDKRTRASILLESLEATILVDTSPELRLQMVASGVDSIDAVFYTHMHADHTAGFDDLRAFWFHSKKELPVYLLPIYENELRERFSYAFKDTGYLGATPQVSLRKIQGDFKVNNLDIETVVLEHGHVKTCGFRIGKFCYATDFKRFSPQDIERWRGKIDVMVASGIHFGNHSTHSVIPETLELFDQLEVRRGIISHLSHDISYLNHSHQLPKNREFAYDGMVIDL